VVYNRGALMKITINVVGQVEEKSVEKVRSEIDGILSKLFQSYKFNWEMIKGVDEK
jgi:hypothetical protein